MKRRLLMPLLIAGLMITTALCVSSCNKAENNADLNVSVPMVETPIFNEGDEGAFMVCPYCEAHLPPGTTNHIHLFGPGGTMPVGPAPQDHLYPVDWCNSGYQPDEHGNVQVCPYSGELQGNETMITYLMNRYGYTREQAIIMLLPRFHRHRLVYDLYGADGGTANKWHVGGGTN